MINIVGIHFWDKKVHLSWSESESISTASFNLPANLRRDDILEDDYALQDVFRAIKEYLALKASIKDFGMIIAVPDDFGVNDIRRIYDVGKRSGIEIVTTVSETMAMSLSIYMDYEFDGRLISIVVKEETCSIAEFEFSEDGVEKIDTYVAGEWEGARIPNASFLHRYGKKLFNNSDAEIIFMAGNQNTCLSFESALNNYIERNDAFFDRKVPVKMLDSKTIVEGLGLLSGKLEEREAFQGLGVIDTLCPYEICMSINGEVYSVLAPESPVPGDGGLEMKKLPESGMDTQKFTIYENRNNRFNRIGSVVVPSSELKHYLRKNVWVGLSASEDRLLTLIVQNIETEDFVEFPIIENAEIKSSGDSEMDLPKFIEKILPIIDNLEYAAKYAKKEDSPYSQGIIQSYTNAVKILEQCGVKIISGEGEPFDYNLQNAVAHVEDPNLPDNSVKQVMQTGYMYNGKIIRTASVIVAN